MLIDPSFYDCKLVTSSHSHCHFRVQFQLPQLTQCVNDEFTWHGRVISCDALVNATVDHFGITTLLEVNPSHRPPGPVLAQFSWHNHANPPRMVQLFCHHWGNKTTVMKI
jgi:hypothetical protein